MVEYAAPNTLKEIHVGHLRNFLVGQAMVNLLKSGGHKVIPVSYINDTGNHAAQVVWWIASRRSEVGDRKSELTSAFLAQTYRDAVQYVKDHPEVEREVRETEHKIEAGEDTHLLNIWKQTRDASVHDIQKIFRELGLPIKAYFFDHALIKPGKKIVDKLVRDGVARKSEGAIIADLKDHGLDVLVLLRSDGSSTYGGKDLALVYAKQKKFKFHEHIHVVDVRQSLYLKQIYYLYQKLGIKMLFHHLSYEFVSLPEGVIAGRIGRVVTYETFRDELIRLAIQETTKRHAGWSSKKIKKTARAIAFAAMRYEMLSYDLDRPIVFEMDRALAFEGATGPYLLYSLARINSILKKAHNAVFARSAEGGPKQSRRLRGRSPWQSRDRIPLASLGVAKTGEAAGEKPLLLILARYESAVAKAAEDLKPLLITHYLFDLAKSFASFYESVPVLQAAPAERALRIQLIKKVQETMGAGLKILGIEPITEM